MGGYVYLICDPDKDAYKIGVTRNLNQNRIKKLQTGNASELHMVTYVYCDYPFRLETILHNRFKSKQATGEWFYLNSEDVINFNETANSIIDTIMLMKDNIFFNKNLK